MDKQIKSQTKTAYTILKQLGNDTIRKYIEAIPSQEFDSHDFINPFLEGNEGVYCDMLVAHRSEGKFKYRNQRISNLMGIYLGDNQGNLHISKIGESESENINGTISICSKWRK